MKFFCRSLQWASASLGFSGLHQCLIHQHKFWGTQEEDRTAKGVINQSQPILLFKRLSWVEGSGVTQQSLLDDAVLRSQVGVPFPQPLVSSLLGRGTRGKSHLPSTAIPSTSLDYLSSSVPTQRGELHVQLEVSLCLPLLSWEWPTVPQALDKVEMVAVSRSKFPLTFSSKNRDTHHLKKRFLTVFGVQFNDLYLQRAILILRLNQIVILFYQLSFYFYIVKEIRVCQLDPTWKSCQELEKPCCI